MRFKILSCLDSDQFRARFSEFLRTPYVDSDTHNLYKRGDTVSFSLKTDMKATVGIDDQANIRLPKGVCNFMNPKGEFCVTDHALNYHDQSNVGVTILRENQAKYVRHEKTGIQNGDILIFGLESKEGEATTFGRSKTSPRHTKFISVGRYFGTAGSEDAKEVYTWLKVKIFTEKRS